MARAGSAMPCCRSAAVRRPAAARGRRDPGRRHAHESELILVATGPLTNIALALTRAPKLARQVNRLVLTAPSKEPGNVTPAAEFNIWHDPEAARIVFRAFAAEGAMPLIAVGLDVTRKP